MNRFTFKTLLYRVATVFWIGLSFIYTDPASAYQVPKPKPDLIMLQVDPNDSTVNAGENLAVSDTVKNQGPADAKKFKVLYGLSENTTYGEKGDIKIGGGSSQRAGLGPAAGASDASSSFSIEIPEKTPPGTYHVCASVSSTPGESDKNNNTICSTGTVTVPPPDLIVSVLSTTTTSATAGSVIQVSLIIKNQGGSQSNASKIELHASTSSTYGDPDDQSPSTKPGISKLEPGHSKIFAHQSVKLPDTPGVYFICAKANADGVVTESDETNNTLCTGTTVTVLSGGGGGGKLSLVFVGNTNPAIITAGNAAKLTDNVIGSGDAATVITGPSSQNTAVTEHRSSGLTVLTRRLNRGFRETLLQPRRAISAQRVAPAVIPINETEPCDSGSVHTFGTLNNNGTGTLKIVFNGCRIGDDTWSGKAALRVDAFDLGYMVPTDFTVSFPSLSLLGSGVDVAAGGSLRSQWSIGTNTETITENLVALDYNTGEVTKAENLVFVNVYNNIFGSSSYTGTISGRVFDSVHGFVDVTTIAPLVFSALTQSFPDSGQMLLAGAPTGAGNRSIRVAALNSATVRLDLDLDGVNGFENTATLKLTDLSGPVGSDLADNDNDGMHNSWETANGLNPNNAADAALDKDGDGVSNLAEYRHGTDASDPGSIPPVWVPTATAGAPEARTRHMAVWSGSEMIVWGGDDFNAIAKNTGGRFDPLAKTWTPTTTVGAPSARFYHTAIWTGTEMIVWGGLSGAFSFLTLNDGGKYNPQTDTWTPITTVNAPSVRFNHTAIWTGTEMIVWGGFSFSDSGISGGARYNPATDTWTPISTTGAPSARGDHSAVWTGSKMIIWGGQNSSELIDSGGIYDPVSNSWLPTNLSGVPAPRSEHAAAWTGSAMIIFGGRDPTGSTNSFNTGGLYNPTADSWTPTNTVGAPVFNLISRMPSVWTGTEMIIWGGEGGRYNPVTNSWRGISTSGAPTTREHHSLVWTGSTMIGWGGNFGGTLNTGGIYDPSVDSTP